MRVGIYARVSTEQEQDPQVQVTALRPWLEANGHEVVEIYTDRISGSKSYRPGLKAIMGAARDGEIEGIAIVRLDRLGRSVAHLLQVADELRRRGVDLIVKDQNIDTSTPAGKMMFTVLAAVAELERDLISQRTKEGLAHRRAQGVRLGRPPQEHDALEIRKLVYKHGSVRAASRASGLGRKLIGRILKTG